METCSNLVISDLVYRLEHSLIYFYIRPILLRWVAFVKKALDLFAIFGIKNDWCASRDGERNSGAWNIGYPTRLEFLPALVNGDKHVHFAQDFSCLVFFLYQVFTDLEKMEWFFCSIFFLYQNGKLSVCRGCKDYSKWTSTPEPGQVCSCKFETFGNWKRNSWLTATVVGTELQVGC